MNISNKKIFRLIKHICDECGLCVDDIVEYERGPECRFIVAADKWWLSVDFHDTTNGKPCVCWKLIDDENEFAITTGYIDHVDFRKIVENRDVDGVFWKGIEDLCRKTPSRTGKDCMEDKKKKNKIIEGELVNNAIARAFNEVGVSIEDVESIILCGGGRKHYAGDKWSMFIEYYNDHLEYKFNRLYETGGKCGNVDYITNDHKKTNSVSSVVTRMRTNDYYGHIRLMLASMGCSDFDVSVFKEVNSNEFRFTFFPDKNLQDPYPYCSCRMQMSEDKVTCVAFGQTELDEFRETTTINYVQAILAVLRECDVEISDVINFKIDDSHDYTVETHSLSCYMEILDEPESCVKYEASSDEDGDWQGKLYYGIYEAGASKEYVYGWDKESARWAYERIHGPCSYFGGFTRIVNVCNIL